MPRCCARPWPPSPPAAIPIRSPPISPGRPRPAAGKLPGYGHPLHKPVDPRAERILALADERRVAGPAVDIARRIVPAAAKVFGRPLPMNVSMAIAALLVDLDFPPAMAKALPILARTAGLLAHLAEEQQRPIGFLLASKAEEAIAYDGGDDA